MRVERRDVSAMLEDDRIAVAVLHAAEHDFPIACREYRRARRRRVVDTSVRPNGIENRMSPIEIETRADSSEVDRCSNKRLPYAATIGREVVGAPGSIDEACRAVRRSSINEFRCNDFAVAELDTVAPEFLVYDGELVADSDVLNEVDVPLKDSGHVHRDGIGDPGRHAGLEQRVLNNAMCPDGTNVDFALDNNGRKSLAVAADLQHSNLVELPVQGQDATTASQGPQSSLGSQMKASLARTTRPVSSSRTPVVI